MAITLQPEQIQQYQNWEQSSNNDLPGRYSMGFQGTPVFSVMDHDRPITKDSVSVEESGDQVIVTCSIPTQEQRVVLTDASYLGVHRILQACDGKTVFSEIVSSLAPKYTEDTIFAITNALLGCAIELKKEVATLEKGISRAEIVRFPMQSPYLLLRQYWSNSLDVRNAVPALFSNLNSLEAFKTCLADLHILATMGKSLDSYYGGSGGVATIPGGYRLHPVRTGLTEEKYKFINLYLEKIGIKKLAEEERYILSKSKAILGLTADQGRTIRHPPPENNMLEIILEETRLALIDVYTFLNEKNMEQLTKALACFHKLFLHAHPFYNINNSIAMNIINYILIQADNKFIPHLLLDFIALRIEFEDYFIVFDQAVKHFAFHGKNWEQESDVITGIKEYHQSLQSIQTAN